MCSYQYLFEQYLFVHIKIVFILNVCVQQFVTPIPHSKKPCLIQHIPFLMKLLSGLFDLKNFVHDIVRLVIPNDFGDHKSNQMHFMGDGPILKVDRIPSR